MEPLAQRGLNPDLQKSLMFLAKAEKLKQERKFQEAVGAFQQAIKIFPMNGAAFRGFIAMLVDLGEIENAGKVARLIPPELYQKSKELQNIHGVLLIEQGHYAEAIRILKSLEPIEAIDKRALYNNLGTAYNRQEIFDEALDYYLRAFQAGLRTAILYRDIAGIYQKKEELKTADRFYQEALQRYPDDIELPYEYAIFLMKSERFAEGFKKYHFRWKSVTFNGKPSNLPLPLWDGKKPVKHLLVVGEQGVGDQAVFSAFLPALRTKVEKVDIAFNTRLDPFFRRTFPEFGLPGQLLYPDHLKKTYDAYIEAGDLGAVLPEAINWEKGWLKADPEKTAALREKYQRMFPGKKLIGLSWKSKRVVYGVKKSIDIATWKPVLDLDQCQFISLQYGDVEEDLRRAREELGVEIYVDPEIDSFTDLDGLAAQANALDLLITTSNTTAHIAAATNAPTWVLLPMGSGLLWYWGYKPQCRWYPHVRLFRTRDSSDWTKVINEVADALKEKIK
jgi:tetratricopeptide (TPR) repeat protein